MEKAETTAREFAEAFKKLSQDVELYGVKFDNFAKKQKDAWDTQVGNLKTEISNLKVDLEG